MPMWIIVAALAVAAILAAASFFFHLGRRPLSLALGVLRLLFLAGLAWCLLMPEKRVVLTQVLKPRFLVALDTSASMRLAPPQQTSNRWDAARAALRAPWAAALAPRCDVEVLPFADGVAARLTPAVAATLAPTGTATRLRETLARLADQYRGQNVAGLLVLSDGLDTREPNDDWAAAPAPWPVYTLRLEPVATWEAEPDARVDSAATPRRVTVGWSTELKAVVSGQGTQGQPVTVHLRRDGAVQQEQATVIPAEGGAREVVFPLEHPAIGVFQYEVSVPPLPGETRTNDNTFAVAVQVVDARNRLLYVEGPPRWESKYLTRALQANDRVTPVCFIRGPGGRFLTIGPSGRLTPDMTDQQLALFKIVVLGNLDAAELGAERAANLVRFVDAGGSLVLLGGPRAWGAGGFAAGALAPLLPLRPTGAASEGKYAVRLTDAGRAHPAFAGDRALWEAVPPILSLFPAGTPAPGAEVLVTAQGPGGPAPAIVVQRYGQGKVVAILTDSLWRWQLDAANRDRAPYPRFWNQLLGWLCPSAEQGQARELELFAAREQIFQGETLDLSARVRVAPGADAAADLVPEARLTMPDGRVLPFAMERRKSGADAEGVPVYACRFTPQAPGLYTAVAAGRRGDVPVESEPLSFYVKPFTPESVPRPANGALLETLARTSGGRFFENPAAMDQALAALAVGGREEASATYESLWQRWPWLVALMVLLAIEWSIRKWKDLA